MRSLWYKSNYVLILFSLIVFMHMSSAQTPSRIKVWYSPPSTEVEIGNQSEVATPPTSPLKSKTVRSSVETGYYLEVDTTTSGTAMTFMVTTTADTGAGSFFKAITDANNNPGLDYVQFSIGSGPQTLAPNFAGGMPLIMSPVVIDGTTQPGFSGTPIIELNGSNLGSEPGLVILAGNSTIRGLVINRCQHSAIQLASGGSNVIETNFIGTNIAGSDSLPNLGYGIHILNSSNNRIGDTLSTARNIIAGNHFPHVRMEGPGSTGNAVLGNYIGTDRQGLSDLSGETNGILITDGASSNTVGGLRPGSENLISGNDFPDIFIGGAGTSYNVVQGNRIGTGLLGLTVMENGNGIRISGGASNNLIGHTTIAGRNIISGSIDPWPGLVIDSSTTTNNVVQGNFIGAPLRMDYSFGNSDGVLILNAPNNTIGGTLVGASNRIAGNRRHGIRISGSLASGNRIEGNLIGGPFVPLELERPLGNLGSGVFIQDAPGNVIGGIDPFAKNTISTNGQHGIVIRGDTATANAIQGNLIGDDGYGVFGGENYGNGGHGVLLIASNDTIGGNDPSEGNIIAFNKQIGVYDSAGINNLIRYNSIFSNDSMEIDLAPRGITPNDPQDDDLGVNNLQNFPILDSAVISQGSIRIRGRLDSKPGTTYTLDFFRGEKRNHTFFGGGETWIGTSTKTCDGAGHADINETFLVAVGDSQFITATAIDPNGNTSEFSRALCMKDRDGDGILDCWETEHDGIDWNADGIIDLNLYAHRARPDHKDVFVEVDFMEPYRPATTALYQVYSAFANIDNSLVNNPDGNRGINLHIELDPTETPVFAKPWAADPWPEFQIEKVIHFGATSEQVDPNWNNILEAKKLVYRYCIFADRFPVATPNGITFPSGLARTIPGNDFIVSLGAFNPSGGTSSQQAGTFMHELGHTLGLRHGGNDDDHYKLNYYSVMNYLFQLPQNLEPGTWRLGYSGAELPVLNELQLDEQVGLNPPAGMFPKVKIPYTRPNGTIGLALLYPNTVVDWDGSGTIEAALVSVDINHFYPSVNLPTPGQTMHGYADWPNLQYNFRNTPGVSLAKHSDPHIQEMTPEEYEYLLTLPPYGIESPLIYWSSDPNINIPISTAPFTQGQPLVAGDGEGGAYISWGHNPGFPSPTSVWAQRVDAFGAIQWMNNGIPVAVSSDVQTVMDIIADGQGNAIILWQVIRTGSYDIMAQKINQFGQELWTSNGVSITTIDGTQVSSKLISDGVGGAIIVWSETHSGSRFIYAQRIGGAGDVQWTPGGALITATSFGDAIKVAKDGTGGVIITWTDIRNGGSRDIYSQKVSAAGLVQWTANGVLVCDASDNQRQPALVSNGFGGAIVTWLDFRSGANNIYAQHLDSSGQTLWTTNGIAVTSIAGPKENLEIVIDGLQGAILSWLDGRRGGFYRDAYAQRVSSAGGTLWTANGVAISDTLFCSEPTVISNSNQGAIIVFARQVTYQGIEPHIFAQLIDSTGSIVWARNGVPITLANGTPINPSATSDLAGGAIIAWRDNRNVPLNSGINHIYAQNVTSSGGLGGGITTGVDQSPTSEVPSKVSLQQNYPNPFNPSTTIRYELPKRSVIRLKIYNVLGQVVATLVDRIQEPGSREVQFNARNLASGVYFYRLEATSVDNPGTNFTQVRKLMLIK